MATDVKYCWAFKPFEPRKAPTGFGEMKLVTFPGEDSVEFWEGESKLAEEWVQAEEVRARITTF